MQVLLFYDHWDDKLMIFEALYQMVMTIDFLVRIGNNFFNYEKVCF